MDAQFDLVKTSRFGITPEILQKYQILILPENYLSASSVQELVDAADSIGLSKLLKNSGIACANSYDLGLNASTIERRSSDKWLGEVFIMDKLVIPIFVGVVAGLIVLGVEKAGDNNKKEEPKIHVDLKIYKDEKFTSIKYDGDSSTLIKILKTISEEDNKKDGK